jgi:hypothetical protein
MTEIDAMQVGAVLYQALPNDHESRLRMIETFRDTEVISDGAAQRLQDWSAGLERGEGAAP